MRKILFRSIFAFFMLILVACSKGKILNELEQIKDIGNEDPQKALVMLDSLELEIREYGDYAKAKYNLLRIRLNDKAYNMHKSDIVIKKLVKYFEDEGTMSDKQEVYYYAGSVYRDLQDTPRALESYFKSLDYAADNMDCDSMMLRNTYSNLNYLHYRVQNYREAVDMAKKELDVSKKIGGDCIISYMHIGTSYLALDSFQQAKNAFDTAYVHIVRSSDISKYQDPMVRLLCGYSDLGELAKAKKCLSLIKINPLEDYDAFSCIAFAQYYASSNKLDSAAFYCKHVLDEKRDIYNMYDAVKILCTMYSKIGDVHNTSLYAGKYMQLSDSLDFGKRQEQAATVNNRNQYHLDQKKEQDLRDEKERYRNILVVVSFAVVLLSSFGYIIYIRRRNRHLQEIVALSSELQRVSENDRQLRKDIASKEQELIKSRASLDKSTEELDNVQEKLRSVNAELAEKGKALEDSERHLSDKIEQNKTLINLLHQSELEGKAEDIIYAVRQSSMGKKNMKPADWKRLYNAVDELYPLFKDRMLKNMESFTEKKMQMCYLMRIGLSDIQIRNLTGLSRTTAWRWTKDFDWVLTTGEEKR